MGGNHLPDRPFTKKNLNLGLFTKLDKQTLLTDEGTPFSLVREIFHKTLFVLTNSFSNFH